MVLEKKVGLSFSSHVLASGNEGIPLGRRGSQTRVSANMVHDPTAVLVAQRDDIIALWRNPDFQKILKRRRPSLKGSSGLCVTSPPVSRLIFITFVLQFYGRYRANHDLELYANGLYAAFFTLYIIVHLSDFFIQLILSERASRPWALKNIILSSKVSDLYLDNATCLICHRHRTPVKRVLHHGHRRVQVPGKSS